MAKPKLRDLMKQAQDHIKAGRYDDARAILERIDAKVDNATVKKWLARLDEIADDPFNDLDFPDASQKKKKRGKLWWAGVGIGACMLLTICSMLGQAVGIIPDVTEIAQTSVAQAVATDVILSQTPPTATETLVPSETPIPTNTPTITLIPTNSPVPSDTIAPSETPLPSSTVMPSYTPLPSATVMPTIPTATATLEFASQEEVEIFEWLSQQAGVESVTNVISSSIGDGTTIFSEIVIIVPVDSMDVNIAEQIRTQLIAIHGISNKDIDITVFMDDGTQRVAFGWNQYSNGWTETLMTYPVVPIRDGINAYSCPSTDCSIIRTFNTDDVLPSSGVINGWAYIVIKDVLYFVQEDDVEAF